MDAYAARDRDVAYWYGERAMTGLLAAAAWHCGGWSLEEFTGRRGVKRRRSGRGDLWLSTGKGNYTVEAKVVWPGSSRTEFAVSTANRALREASRQLRTLSEDFVWGRRVAVCYIVPDLAKQSLHSEPQKIESLFDGVVANFRKAAVVATYRPRSEVPSVHRGRCYPGVILVGQRV